MKTGDFHANKVSGVRKNGTPSANGHQGHASDGVAKRHVELFGENGRGKNSNGQDAPYRLQKSRNGEKDRG